MLKRQPLLSSCLLVGGAIALFFWTRPEAISSPTPPAPPAYGSCPPSRDGIGKTFMGLGKGDEAIATLERARDELRTRKQAGLTGPAAVTLIGVEHAADDSRRRPREICHPAPPAEVRGGVA